MSAELLVHHDNSSKLSDIEQISLRTNDNDSYKELKTYNNYIKVLFVPISETGEEDLSKSYVTHIRFSHIHNKNYWYEQLQNGSKQSFLFQDKLFINEDGDSFRAYDFTDTRGNLDRTSGTFIGLRYEKR